MYKLSKEDAKKKEIIGIRYWNLQFKMRSTNNYCADNNPFLDVCLIKKTYPAISTLEIYIL